MNSRSAVEFKTHVTIHRHQTSDREGCWWKSHFERRDSGPVDLLSISTPRVETMSSILCPLVRQLHNMMKWNAIVASISWTKTSYPWVLEFWNDWASKWMNAAKRAVWSKQMGEQCKQASGSRSKYSIILRVGFYLMCTGDWIISLLQFTSHCVTQVTLLACLFFLRFQKSNLSDKRKTSKQVRNSG